MVANKNRGFLLHKISPSYRNNLFKKLFQGIIPKNYSEDFEKPAGKYPGQNLSY